MITKNRYSGNSFISLSELDSMIFVTGWKHWVAAGSGTFHEHSGLELVYHPASSGKVNMGDGTSVEFEAGDIVITPPGFRHAQHNSIAGYDHCLIADFSEVQAGLQHYTVIVPEIKDEFILRELDCLTSGIVSNHPTHMSLDYRVKALFASLLEKKINDRKNFLATIDYVSTACRLINESYTDAGLEIHMIATKVGISSDYLRHLFKSRLGISPKQYLLQQRIERIKELLVYSTLSLKEIAELSGFSNERYLCFYFRNELGMTPGMFRKRQRS